MTIDQGRGISFAGVKSGGIGTKYLAALLLVALGATGACAAAEGESEPELSEDALDPVLDENAPAALDDDSADEIAGLSAPADEVLNWNAIAQTTTLPTPPPMASRSLAITQLAVFDAVNSIVRSYSSFAVNLRAPKGRIARCGGCRGSTLRPRTPVPDRASLARYFVCHLAGRNP